LDLHFCLIILFWVHHRVNRDDRKLLAHAMDSDFSVAKQMHFYSLSSSFAAGVGLRVFTVQVHGDRPVARQDRKSVQVTLSLPSMLTILAMSLIISFGNVAHN
jgi:hypothetical protein